MINKLKPIKVSSLNEAESIDNLYSLGVDNNGNSVKVPIQKLRGNEGPQGPQGIAGDSTADKTIFNVSLSNNNYAYADSTAARNAVPAGKRNRGQILIYTLSDGTVMTEKYIGANIADWSSVANWEELGVDGGGNSDSMTNISLNENGRASKEDGTISADSNWRNTAFVAIDTTGLSADMIYAKANLDCSAGSLAAPVVFYDKDKKFISSIERAGAGFNTYQLTKENTPANTGYIVFSSQSSNIAAAYVQLTSLLLIFDMQAEMKVLNSSLSDMQSQSENVQTMLATKIGINKDGRASKEDGTINDSTDWRNTGFIEVNQASINSLTKFMDVYIDCSFGSLTAPVCFYNSSKAFISAIAKPSDGFNIYTLDKSNIPATAAYIVISTRQDTLASAYINDYSKSVTDGFGTIAERVDTIENFLDLKTLDINKIGRASNVDGSINDHQDWRNTGLTAIDRSRVNLKPVYLSAYLDCSGAAVAAPVVFYDENEVFISAINNIKDGFNLYQLTKSNIPTNAAHFAISTRKNTLAEAYVRYGSTTEGDNSDTNLPDYHFAELNRIVEEINDSKNYNFFSFPFVTDMHMTGQSIDYSAPKNALVAAAEISKRVNVDALVLGGDFTNTQEGNPGSMSIAEVRKCLSDIALWTNSMADRRVWLKGNHELKHHTNKAKYMDMTQKFLVNDGRMVYNEDDPTGSYGYIDYDFYKVRLLFLDTSLIEYTGGTGSEDKQLVWLIEKGLNMTGKDGWMSIVAGHIPLYSYWQTGGYWHTFPNYRKLISAFHRGNSVTLNMYGGSRTIDFGTQGATPMFFVAGHCHTTEAWTDAQYINASNDMDFITITSRDSSTTRSSIHANNRGTKDETSFDFFMVDPAEKKIYIKRYGYGNDREISFD